MQNADENFPAQGFEMLSHLHLCETSERKANGWKQKGNTVKKHFELYHVVVNV